MAMDLHEAFSRLDSLIAERDQIQANLLALDGSFGKRLLAGAALTGGTKARWEEAAAGLAALWETFTAYSAVIDQAAELRHRLDGRGGNERDIARISGLLTGTPVRVPRPDVPVAGRRLTDSDHEDVTLATAVKRMSSAFSRITGVVGAAEAVWNTLMERLDGLTPGLKTAQQQADGLADSTLSAAVAEAASELAALREAANSDPLNFWSNNRLDTARLDRLESQIQAVASTAGELVRLRDDADRRIAAAGRAIRAAQQAEQDASIALSRAREKISEAALPGLPATAATMAGQLSGLEALKSQGRWRRLAAELDAIERQAASAAEGFRDAERAAVGLLDRRSELRGLLDGYRAKAASLGGAEDPSLTARFAKAHDLLWTAPCDLAAAADAVTSYTQAVVAFAERRPQR